MHLHSVGRAATDVSAWAVCAVAARVQGALSLALLHHAAFRDSLVQQMGFTILEVASRVYYLRLQGLGL